PDALADAHERFIDEFGLNIVGGCCGTTPAHLRAVVDRIGTRAPVARTPEFEPSCSSIYSPVTFHQELAYLAIGERTNANGSKKFREAMLEADWDTCVQMARDQVKEGAHVLDVCVDYVGRDGAVDMHEIVSRFATQAALPLVFDSTEPAIRHLLNSVFLHECREAGLDAAIVHAARIMPMHKIDDHVREVTLDLVYDRRADGYDPLTELMALFEGVDATAVEQEDRSGWPIEQRLEHRIIDGNRDGLEADLEEQLA